MHFIVKNGGCAAFGKTVRLKLIVVYQKSQSDLEKVQEVLSRLEYWQTKSIRKNYWERIATKSQVHVEPKSSCSEGLHNQEEIPIPCL